MKTAMILAYAIIVVLAIILFMQWRTIQKLIPAPAPGNGAASERKGDGSGSFGDQMAALQKKLEPREITVKY